ncbi:hypothetical protein HMPREF1982_04112 [Clostridiales bacterium oral taxon 876 str. F0540]|nr:hypothetical protein HMPREF1982_04112 [Clostridiales bacterium oral taxon 876 str. F0540]
MGMISMKNNDVKKLVQSSLLLAVVIVFQIIGSRIPGLNQYIVGSVVNAALLVTVFVSGTFYGTAVGVLTPWTALLVGQLKPAMAPFIPFIMLGNAIFAIAFGIIYKREPFGKYAGIIIGAILKFGFLYLSANKIIYALNMNFPKKVAEALSVAMGATQLVTALLGGLLAFVLIEIIFKRIKLTNETRSAL